MDQPTLNKIALLHPKVRAEVEHIYKAQIVPILSGRAFCRFTHTLRTFQEQADLYAQGRTKLYDAAGRRLGKVTNAKPGFSFHNYGLAIDIVLVVGSAAKWDIVTDYDGDRKADWMEVVSIFKANGWTWGGDFRSFKDYPHFEKAFGNSISTLKAKHDAKNFIPGTNYVNI